MRQLLLTLVLGTLALTGGCGGSKEPEKAKVVMMTDAVGRQLGISRDMVKAFEAEHDCEVEFVAGPDNATERLGEYQKFFAARSHAIDVYQIDIIWPGILAPHLVDLSDTITGADFFPAIIENNTVEGKLVAAPFYTDAGLLYYRTDLLTKHGFEAPPKTLDELESMARTIMDGERADGNTHFHGIVFQGGAYEGLTCNALEWQYGAGGGRIVAPDGKPELDNEGTRTMLTQVAGWIGTIAPRGVLAYKEEESRAIFQSGNAAFMRNWPYAYALGQAEDSPIRDKFSVAPMPGNVRAAGTLGGWNLAVSRHSKQQELAKKLVAFLTSEDANRRRALEGGYLSVRPAIYGDPALDAEVPYYNRMRPVLDAAVARPSTPAGVAYNEISATYFQAVHDVLSGHATADAALPVAEKKIAELMAKP